MKELAGMGDRIPLDMHAALQGERGSWHERYPGEVAAGFRIERLRARLRQAELVAEALDAQCQAAHVALDELRLRDDVPEVLEREPDAVDYATTQLAETHGMRKRAAARTGRIRQHLDEALWRDSLGLPPVEGAGDGLGDES